MLLVSTTWIYLCIFWLQKVRKFGYDLHQGWLTIHHAVTVINCSLLTCMDSHNFNCNSLVIGHGEVALWHVIFSGVHHLHVWKWWCDQKWKRWFYKLFFLFFSLQRFTQYLASSNSTFQLSNFLDKSGVQGVLKIILYSMNFKNAVFVYYLVTVKVHGWETCMIVTSWVTGALDCSVLV